MIESNVVGQELSTLTPVNYDKNYGKIFRMHLCLSLHWLVTTAFYETVVAQTLGEKLGGGHAPPGPSPCYGPDNTLF